MSTTEPVTLRQRLKAATTRKTIRTMFLTPELIAELANVPGATVTVCTNAAHGDEIDTDFLGVELTWAEES